MLEAVEAGVFGLHDETIPAASGPAQGGCFFPRINVARYGRMETDRIPKRVPEQIKGASKRMCLPRAKMRTSHVPVAAVESAR
jgi:hypothetical protein